MKQTLICPVCNSPMVDNFLQRKNVAIHQHLLVESADAARSVSRGDLTLACCKACAFIFNSSFEQAKLGYGEQYENTQTCSLFYNNYINRLINYLVEEKSIQNSCIIEVGCGQGTFLKRLIERGEGNCGYGFDPSYRGPKTIADGRINFFASYYGPDCTDIKADIVICRHVIEHVPDPVALLTSIKEAVENSPKALLFLETPSVTWILRENAFWDFFYEHCAYFTAHSLARAVEAAGFTVQKVLPEFNGQYLWLEASNSREKASDAVPLEQIHVLVEQFADREKWLITQWRNVIQNKLLQGEKIAVWGAGAKGATFVSLIDPECKYLNCVIDINPKKQGNFIPGTGHQILEAAALVEREISSVIILNPNYREEVLASIKGLPATITLIEMEHSDENYH